MPKRALNDETAEKDASTKTPKTDLYHHMSDAAKQGAIERAAEISRKLIEKGEDRDWESLRPNWWQSKRGGYSKRRSTRKKMKKKPSKKYRSRRRKHTKRR
jgi:hypothetical protein